MSRFLEPGRMAVMAAVLALAVLPLTPISEFWITQLNFIGISSLVALGLVLLTGIAGLTSFGQAAFVGIGAYATGYVSVVQHMSPWLGLLAGLVVTVESPPTPMGCPLCGVIAASHGRRSVVLVDAPAFGQSVRIEWRKRMWRCASWSARPGCSPSRTSRSADRVR